MPVEENDASEFYEVDFDPEDPGQWFLGEPRDEAGNRVDARMFTEGRAVEVAGPLTIPVSEPGRPLDFNFAALNMIVVTEEIGELVEANSSDPVQRIPVDVEGQPRRYEILNVCSVVDCIDRTRTRGTVWTSQSHRPDKAGDYRMVIELRLDPERARGHDLFYPRGWQVVLIVSDRVRRALGDAGVSGLVYKSVGRWSRR